MTAEQMWEAYSRKSGIDSSYEAWAFGDDADTLARLVLEGKKTATASAHVLYELEGEPLPCAGEYSVILDSKDDAVCVIRTTRVFVLPFCEIDATQAYREGEGDRSLAYWRRVHEKFFKSELFEVGLEFDDKMKVVCEEFELVFEGEEDEI